jgi:RNA-directed DNA polymerase
MRLVSSSDDDLKRKFLALTTRESVADLLEVPLPRLTYHLFKVSATNKYREFTLLKKSGGTRRILAPAGALKLIQRKLAFVPNRVYAPKPSVNGFVIARNIRSNAERHLQTRYVFNLDLKDFFPSINFGRVRGMFLALPYKVSADAATVLAQICCFNNQLPQGAPTSPIVSNMICSKLDSQLQALAKEHRCVYTRYADDITFSTSLKSFPKTIAHVVKTKTGDEIELGLGLQSLIQGNGFTVNPEKLRIRTANQRQEVTGLTVNRIVNVKRGFVREIRAMLHAWEKFGLEAAEKAHNDSVDKKQRSPSGQTPAYSKIVGGKLSFLSSIRGKDDPTYLKLLRQANRLDPSFLVPPESAAIKTSDDLLKTIWVLECEQDIKQGTAFMLTGVGLVTCDHVLGCATAAFQPHDPVKRYPVEVIAQDATLDLAILKIEPMPAVGLETGNPEAVERLDQVTLLGFPNFNHGDTGLVRRGEVLGFRVKSALRRIIISASVVAGNSGGPLLDSKNRVIGVAVTGADDAQSEHLTENHSAIPINALNYLLPN